MGHYSWLLENLELEKENLSSFKFGSVGANSLLFQCGYLPLRVVFGEATDLLHAELTTLIGEAEYDLGFTSISSNRARLA